MDRCCQFIIALVILNFMHIMRSAYLTNYVYRAKCASDKQNSGRSKYVSFNISGGDPFNASSSSKQIMANAEFKGSVMSISRNETMLTLLLKNNRILQLQVSV